MGLLERPPHTLPACCSPVGRLGPAALDVGLQGNGKSLLQLVHHAALHHTWAVCGGREDGVVPARPWGQTRSGQPESANGQPTTFRSQRHPGREGRVALEGDITPPTQGEASQGPPPGHAANGGKARGWDPPWGVQRWACHFLLRLRECKQAWGWGCWRGVAKQARWGRHLERKERWPASAHTPPYAAAASSACSGTSAPAPGEAAGSRLWVGKIFSLPSQRACLPVDRSLPCNPRTLHLS